MWVSCVLIFFLESTVDCLRLKIFLDPKGGSLASNDFFLNHQMVVLHPTFFFLRPKGGCFAFKHIFWFKRRPSCVQVYFSWIKIRLSFIQTLQSPLILHKLLDRNPMMLISKVHFKRCFPRLLKATVSVQTSHETERTQKLNFLNAERWLS